MLIKIVVYIFFKYQIYVIIFSCYVNVALGWNDAYEERYFAFEHDKLYISSRKFPHSFLVAFCSYPRVYNIEKW
jgi:hypothetical protein